MNGGVVRWVGVLGFGWVGRGYSWDFGDRTAKVTGASPVSLLLGCGYVHGEAYGDHDNGATDVDSHDVTVTAAPPANGNFAADNFVRIGATGGWGTLTPAVLARSRFVDHLSVYGGPAR